MTLKISLWKLIALCLAIYFFKSFFSWPTTIEITNKEFIEMVKADELEEIKLIRNTKTVVIKAKKEHTATIIKRINEKRRKEQSNNSASTNGHLEWMEKIKESYFSMVENLENVTFILKIPSIEIFNDNYKEAEQTLSEENKIGYKTEEKTFILPLISSIVHFLFTLALLFIIFNPEVIFGAKTGGFSIFGKNKNKIYNPLKDNKITLKNIAGMEEVKEEIREIINLYKNRKEISSLGGRLPKGLLLVGPPGNGKTLIAKAIAGETKLPFISTCGSDFSGIYWGLGTAKVNELFSVAEKIAPCIIFIDEIDSIGRNRKMKISSNEDGENTLNTLLSRMDGFNSSKDILIIGATNRVEIMDPALLREGRFDRQISIDLPHLDDRKKIFALYLKKIPTAKDVDIDILAEITVWFSSAKIEAICMEAAILAARDKSKTVKMIHLQEAIERKEIGIEKKSKRISKEEKEIIAYHECGHAIVGWFLKNCTPLLKVSIIPRGGNILGYAFYSNKEENVKPKEALLDEMCSFLGGRVAEEIIFGTITTGAENDLENVFRIAKMMVTIYGMGDSLGAISIYNSKENDLYRVSEDTFKNIEIEIREIVAKMYKRTKALLLLKLSSLKEMAKALLEKEKLNKEQIEKILGPRTFFVYEEEKKDSSSENNIKQS